jgi:hypothetical protein
VNNLYPASEMANAMYPHNIVFYSVPGCLKFPHPPVAGNEPRSPIRRLTDGMASRRQMEEANLAWHASVRNRADPWNIDDLGLPTALIQKLRKRHKWGAK